MRARALTVVLTVVGLSLTVAVPYGARPAGSASAPLPRVSFVAARGSSILVHGTYPKRHSPCVHPSTPVLHARFPGTIEVGRATDGTLFIIGELRFEDYLKGIGEMPRTWPIEALKAQAVAARSYALANLRYPNPTGRALGYQLCATDACQVYLGMGISAGPYGNRWRAAVDATRGQVLLSHGAPADTLYFSTSNGHTYGNESVFGTDPLPYLRPVAERDDGASPLSHWTARIGLDDMTRFLRTAGHWSTGRVTSARTSGSEVVLRSSAAPRSRRMSVAGFRIDMNSWASCLDPSSYPDGGLPQTVPSQWFSMTSSNGGAVLHGRGWGHGVGMVQWGAEGKAARGLSYARILADYYGGLRPVPFDEPATIRVGIATGLSSVEVVGTGSVSASGTAIEHGPWSVTGGRRLRVRAAASLPPVAIHAGWLHGPSRAAGGGRIAAMVSIPQLSVVRLVLRAPDGEDVPISGSRTFAAGTYQLTAAVPRDIVTGDYRLLAQVTNGTDIVHTRLHRVAVAGVARSPSPTSTPVPTPSARRPSPLALPPERSAGSRSALLVGVGLAGAAILTAALLLLRRRRARHA